MRESTMIDNTINKNIISDTLTSNNLMNNNLISNELISDELITDKTVMNNNVVKLIYAGGTFGCHGTPLAPLSADIFLPHLLSQLQAECYDVGTIDNELIKDSSQLTLADFVHFYQLILRNYQLGYRQFVLITGTDTLSYLGAFLAECFIGSDIVLSLTASMKPLFDANCDTMKIDSQSDAWANLQGAIHHCVIQQSGVYICMAEHNWFAQSVQKLDSHSLNAFVGESFIYENIHKNIDKNSSYYRQLYCPQFTQDQRQSWADERIYQLVSFNYKVDNIVIASVFMMPNNEAFIATQLQTIFASAKKEIAVILLGFGAGNIPYSRQLADILDFAYRKGHMVISSTQCPFGGVSADYLAGSWQYQHHVLSGGKLTKEAIFARVLWLYLSCDSIAERRELWLQSLNKELA